MKTPIIAALALSGCATITNGTQQTITFAPPEHQVCAVTRVDGFLGSVQASTPTITVERNRHPITLHCGDSVTVYEPKINAAGYTSIGLIDFGLVDFATGRYGLTNNRSDATRWLLHLHAAPTRQHIHLV